MKQLDSNALGFVDRALGLAGAGSQQTELEDGLVAQTLDVRNLVARSRSPIRHGQKWAVLQNVHVGTTDQVSAIDPYFQGTIPIAPYLEVWNWPVPVPVGFDIWYLGSTCRVVTGTGFTEGYFGMVGGMVGPNPAGAFGYTHSGTGITNAAIRYPLQSWSGETVVAAQTFANAISTGQQIYSTGQNGVRIPRDATLEFRSRSSGNITVQVTALVGLFPQALGQDVIT